MVMPNMLPRLYHSGSARRLVSRRFRSAGRAACDAFINSVRFWKASSACSPYRSVNSSRSSSLFFAMRSSNAWSDLERAIPLLLFSGNLVVMSIGFHCFHCCDAGTSVT